MADRDEEEVAELATGLAEFAGEIDGALVLGSGLGAFVERLQDARTVSFAELPGMPRSTVPGHAGRFCAGTVAGRRLLVQAGRVHFYEGHDASAVTRSTRAMARLAARWCLFTNAAGGIEPGWSPGTFMAIVDHLDLQWRGALGAGEGGRRTPYSKRGIEALDRAAETADVAIVHGIYAGSLGPAYETPAEIRLLRKLGAHAVGMSTVAEAQAAAVCGLGVAAVSCITNHAAGVSSEPLLHADVVAAGARAAPRFVQLLEAAVAELDATFSG